MQEAFRRGINGEYGEFFGITAASLTGFLRGYMKAEKWQAMKAICYAEEQKKLKDGDRKLFEEMAKARELGFELPEFRHEPFEDDKQHQARVAKQRAEILKLYEKK